jgi:hypothetical protein
MLVQTELLADQFYLLAHHEATGRALLPGRIDGLGTAAALLGELLLDGYIGVRDGEVFRFGDASPRDFLTSAVLARIDEEGQPLSLRTWLAFFGPQASTGVVARLRSEGVLVRRSSGRLRRHGRWAPIDPHVAALVGATLCTRLVRGDEPEERSVLLAGLARASGLEHDHPTLCELRFQPEARQRLDQLLAELPAERRVLLGAVEAAIAFAISARRV